MDDNQEIQLTDKQELFCHEYLVDLNGTKAYMRAFDAENYNSARALASKLLTNLSIRARIKQLMDIRSSNILVDAGYVVERLIHIAEKCQEAEPVLEWDDSTKSMVETGEYKFDSSGANKAMELLGRHLGMFNDKMQHSGKVEGFQIIIDGSLPDTNNQPE